MKIDYDHSLNLHTYEGPQVAFPVIFKESPPKSILDVGCGQGTWLKTATEYGVTDVFGIDGVEIPAKELLFQSDCFKRMDLTQPVDLGRRFDVVICLEVGEHLDQQFSRVLIETLTRHSDIIVFSAAIPEQPGQHHVNCQWPRYWQGLFNERGFVCDDSLRWQLWELQQVEPWYRQNIFIARHDSKIAGNEDRIRSVIHPDMLRGFQEKNSIDAVQSFSTVVLDGQMPITWYPRTLANGYISKIRRNLKK